MLKTQSSRLLLGTGVLMLLVAGVSLAIVATAMRFKDRQVRLATAAHMAVKRFNAEPIETEAAAALLDSTAATVPLFVDVRTSREFKVSRLPAAINWDESRFGDPPREIREAVRDGRPVVFYCSIGYRSGRAADRVQKLLDRGVNEDAPSRLYNLQGGIFLWAEEARPLEGGPGVHPFDEEWGSLLREDLRAEN